MAKLPLSPPPPGPELADLTDAHGRNGPGAVWRIAPRPDDSRRQLAVPLQAVIVGRYPGRVVGALINDSGHWPLSSPPTPRIVLPERLVLALETRHPLALERLQAYDLTAWKRLYAAALRDLLGLEDDAIADACGYGGGHAARTARERYQDGRAHWRQLGAWPWSVFDHSGKPPVGWRQRGGDELVGAAFAAWATGQAQHLGRVARALTQA